MRYYTSKELLLRHIAAANGAVVGDGGAHFVALRSMGNNSENLTIFVEETKTKLNEIKPQPFRHIYNSFSACSFITKISQLVENRNCTSGSRAMAWISM